MSAKTDNSNIQSKLLLRRYFLDKYPPHKVLDCCQGNQEIWGELKISYPVEYIGVDLKPKKGRLKIDSVKILNQPGWDFDVVDIDTYGSPWKHWQALLAHGHRSMTVFLTIGMVKIGGGQMDRKVLSWLGIDKFNPPVPSSLASKLSTFSIPYCLSQSAKHSYEIVEAKEAPASRNALYIGCRLNRVSG